MPQILIPGDGSLPLPCIAENTTVEYLLQTTANTEISVIFVIDIVQSLADMEDGKDPEMQNLTNTIKSVVNSLPESTKVGLITFGKHVNIHATNPSCIFPQTFVFNGGMEESKMENLCNFVHTKLDILLTPAGKCREYVNYLLDLVEPDAWNPKRGMRPDRCTGTAIGVATDLARTLVGSNPARICLFCGGPPTRGPGKVVEESRECHMRNHKDIIENAANHYEKAKEFYNNIATKAACNDHVIDIFVGSLDQTGAAEQRALSETTGGVFCLNDTFQTSVFEESFYEVFRMAEESEALDMLMKGEVTVTSSSEVQVSGHIGKAVFMSPTQGQEQNKCISRYSVGVGGTNRWAHGGLEDTTTFLWTWEIENKNSGMENLCYVQFRCSYLAAGYNYVRVTTLGIPLVNGLMQLKNCFDAEAAAVGITRMAVHRVETEFENFLQYLDNIIIKTSKVVCNYTPNEKGTVALTKDTALFMQLMYATRRSPILSNFNSTPDEYNFMRSNFMGQNIRNSLLMIQPLLFAFDASDPVPRCVKPQVGERHASRVLLLDTFFTIVIWYGKNACSWRDTAIYEEEQYAHIKELLDEPENFAQERLVGRNPFPLLVLCDDGKGQDRFLMARLHPENSNGAYQMDEVAEVLTDDASLEMFTAHLFKCIVAQE